MSFRPFRVPSLVALALTLTAVTRTSPAFATDDATRAAAREIGYEGVKAYEAGDYATATDRFERAYQALKAPSLGLWSARALEKVGKLVEAAERYLETTRLPLDAGGNESVQGEAQREAMAEREQLLPRIPKLVIQVAGAGDKSISVTVGAAELPTALLGEPRPTNPGTVEVVATAGNREVRATVTLAEGERKEVTLELPAGGAPIGPANPVEPVHGDPAPERAPGGDTRRLFGWVGVGVGGAGLLVGGITGGLAAAKRSNLDCPDDVCAPDQQSDVDQYNTFRGVSTAGFIVGGVFAAGGVALLLTSPERADVASSKKPKAAVSPWIGVGSAGLRGRF